MSDDGKVIDLNDALIKQLRPRQVIPADHPAELARQRRVSKAILDRYGYGGTGHGGYRSRVPMDQPPEAE